MKKARPGVGRPTREQQEERHRELLAAALDIFLEKGFEPTTIEEIAGQVGMSKRTVYARYEDKAALFKAAVRRAIELYTVPRAAVAALVQDDIEATLLAIARQRIDNVSTPSATNLQRILGAQSYRFPELFRMSFNEGAGPTIAVLSEVFERATAAGVIRIADTGLAAAAFLSMVVSGPVRLIVAGSPLDAAETERRIRFGVDVFLNGVRAR